MPSKYCCVPKCYNKDDRSYHITTIKEMQEIWIRRIGNPDLVNWRNVSSAHICKNHFHPECIMTNGKLKKFALPTLNLPEYMSSLHNDDIFLDLSNKPSAETPEKQQDSTSGTSNSDKFPELKVQIPTRVYKRKRATPASNENPLIDEELAGPSRDPKGFAIKFYTEEGNWDLVGNNTPIFFLRDPKLFPPFIHSQKPNPVTNLREWNQFWDFLSLRQESVHQVMFLFSDRGIPKSYRHMHGYGSHTFSFVDKNQKLTYCKFHYKTDQGIENLSSAEAQKIAGQDPDFYGRDLYDAIESKNYPSWTFYVQLMTVDEAKTKSYDPFDITKVWPHLEHPLIKVGKFVLNRTPSNFFAEVEQLAFSPSNITPGIWISPDRFLQGRLFSYADAHRYRLGANFAQLPINCPFKVNNYERDGAANVINQGGAPNYYPNSFNGPFECPSNYPPPQQVEGKVGHYDTGKTEDNFKQAKIFYNKVLDASARGRLEDNLVSKIKNVTCEKVKNNVMQMFTNVDQTFGNNLKEKLKKSSKQEGS